jgi:small-conductance mechanosensitive channel
VDVAPGLGPVFRFWTMVAAVIQAGLWGNAAITFGIRRLLRRGGADRQVTVTAATALGFAARVLLFLILLVVALDAAGVQVTTLVAGLGIGSIVVALALQSVLTDLIGALSIVLNRPFLVGDFIETGEHMGTVEYVGLRSTRIRNLPGQELHLPNTYLLQNAIINVSRMGERRVSFSLILAYDTPVDGLARVGGMLKDIIATIPTARFDRAHLKTFGSWGYEYEIVYWILSSDYVVYMDARERINLELLRRFDAEGIHLGSPAAATAGTIAAGGELADSFGGGR